MAARELVDIPSEASFLTGENIGKHVAWFRQRLEGKGIRPPQGSTFGDALRALELINSAFDVRFKIREEDWGIECKMAYSPTPQRIADEIDDKLNQLRDGPATHGLVIVDLTATLEHAPSFLLSLDDASD